MSQDFKLKFDGMRNNNPAAPKDSSLGDEVGENEFYPTSGNSRNLCFAWPDGRRMFLNYAYLVSGKYNLQDSIIELWFSTHHIIIRGSKLEIIFDLLFDQTLRKITCNDERYKILNLDAPVLTEIIAIEV